MGCFQSLGSLWHLEIHPLTLGEVVAFPGLTQPDTLANHLPEHSGGAGGQDDMVKIFEDKTTDPLTSLGDRGKSLMVPIWFIANRSTFVKGIFSCEIRTPIIALSLRVLCLSNLCHAGSPPCPQPAFPPTSPLSEKDCPCGGQAITVFLK